MTDSTLELQKAVLAALKADGAVSAIVSTRIYDRPPQSVSAPYVTFGPAPGDPWDTDGEFGWESRFQIDTWSEKPGRVQALQIMQAIKTVLHCVTLTLDTQTNALSLLEFSNALDDPDGVTTHGVQRFRFLTHA